MTRPAKEPETDPVRFAREVLHIDPWAMQEAIMRAVAAYPRVTVRSCNHSGKTFAAAALAHWFAHAFNPSLVVTTASSARQVKDVLWHEIRQHHARSGGGGKMNQMDLFVSPTQRIVGFSTDEPVRLQGWHCENILVIVDEASGIEGPIYEAIEGILTGPHAKLLLIGNPNRAAGPFYDSFLSDLYVPFRIAAREVPEHLMPPGWPEQMLGEWGEESPAYQVRVMGEFPSQGEDSLISMAWVTAAQEREADGLDTGYPVEMGVDIARYGGDESVAYARRGPVVLAADYWRHSDLMASAGRIAAMARHLSAENVNIDSIGIGAGVVDRLAEEGDCFHGLNVGEAAWDSEHFANRRSEIFWGLRERFRDGDIVIPADDTLLVAQLVALKFSYTPKGQIKLQSKEDMRKERTGARAWQSPDRADAMALAFCSANAFTPGVVVGEGRGWSS